MLDYRSIIYIVHLYRDFRESSRMFSEGGKVGFEMTENLEVRTKRKAHHAV